MPATAEEKQRLFFAVPLNDEVRAEAWMADNLLFINRAPVRFVRIASLHFTLKFLGDTPVSQIPPLSEVARKVAAQTAPFTVGVQGLGVFPDRGWPRIIWAGCAAGKEDFAALGQRLDAALAEAGLTKPDRRPFVPHLTLARVTRGHYPSGASELVETIRQNADLDLGRLPVDRFLLIRSQLEPKGPVYTELAAFELVE